MATLREWSTAAINTLSVLRRDPTLFMRRINEVKEEVDAGPFYGDWLLKARQLRTIETPGGAAQATPGFDLAVLQPINFVRATDGPSYCIPAAEMQRRALEEYASPYNRQDMWWCLNNKHLLPQWDGGTFIVFAGDHDLRDEHERPCVTFLRKEYGRGLKFEGEWGWDILPLTGGCSGTYFRVLSSVVPA